MKKCHIEWFTLYVHSRNLYHSTGQAGHGKGSLLGKDNIAARAFGRLHELFIYAGIKVPQKQTVANTAEI